MDQIAAASVYLMCMATALACCVLLLRGYRRSKASLLLWSGLCFAFLTLDNAILFIDKSVFPSTELWFARAPCSLTAVLLLLYGVAWKTN